MMIMPLVACLTDVLCNTPKDKYTKIIKSCLKALRDSHAKGFIHGDACVGNLFIHNYSQNSEYDIVLGDFETSTPITKVTKEENICEDIRFFLQQLTRGTKLNMPEELRKFIGRLRHLKTTPFIKIVDFIVNDFGA